MTRPLALIQARMGSTRLPGKVLMDVSGRTVLSHVVDRVRACTDLSGVRVATTDQAGDDPVVRECERLGVGVRRGSEDDVLDRFVRAAGDADWIVRVTADCPLFDPVLLGAMIRRVRDLEADGTPVDYLANGIEPSWPRGLDAEIVRGAALRRAHAEATAPHEREHVTPYIYRHPDLFAVHGYRSPRDLAAHRWTLDTPEDLAFVRAVYDALYEPDRLFTTEEVLALLDRRPDIRHLNAHVEQKKLGQ